MDDQRNEEHIPTMTFADERIGTYFGPKISTHLNTQYKQSPYVVIFLEKLIQNTEGSHYDTYEDIQNEDENEGICVSEEMTIMEKIKNLNDFIFYLERKIRYHEYQITDSLKRNIRLLNARMNKFPTKTGLKQIQVDDNLTMATLIGNLKDIHLKLIEILFQEFDNFGDVIVELKSFKDTNLLNNLDIPDNIYFKDKKLVDTVLEKYKEIITTQIKEIWNTLEKERQSRQQKGGSIGSRKKITKKKNKKYNLKKNSKKNKSVKKSKNKKK